ncbi:MAG TPA: hypothetical protein VIE89_08615 [Candidatus Binatia bacterium]|jgi:hypothetical protein
MKAAWYEKQGAVRDVLTVGEMDEPQPLAGEAGCSKTLTPRIITVRGLPGGFEDTAPLPTAVRLIARAASK